jgi:alcohol dehydrogenase
VHGKPVQLNIDTLWSHDITLTTRLADIMLAYDTFSNAMRENALKVIVTNE